MHIRKVSSADLLSDVRLFSSVDVHLPQNMVIRKKVDERVSFLPEQNVTHSASIFETIGGAGGSIEVAFNNLDKLKNKLTEFKANSTDKISIVWEFNYGNPGQDFSSVPGLVALLKELRFSSDQVKIHIVGKGDASRIKSQDKKEDGSKSELEETTLEVDKIKSEILSAVKENLRKTHVDFNEITLSDLQKIKMSVIENMNVAVAKAYVRSAGFTVVDDPDQFLGFIAPTPRTRNCSSPRVRPSSDSPHKRSSGRFSPIPIPNNLKSTSRNNSVEELNQSTPSSDQSPGRKTRRLMLKRNSSRVLAPTDLLSSEEVPPTPVDLLSNTPSPSVMTLSQTLIESSSNQPSLAERRSSFSKKDLAVDIPDSKTVTRSDSECSSVTTPANESGYSTSSHDSTPGSSSTMNVLSFLQASTPSPLKILPQVDQSSRETLNTDSENPSHQRKISSSSSSPVLSTRSTLFVEKNGKSFSEQDVSLDISREQNSAQVDAAQSLGNH